MTLTFIVKKPNNVRRVNSLRFKLTLYNKHYTYISAQHVHLFYLLITNGCNRRVEQMMANNDKISLFRAKKLIKI